jgi:hypothetical protein
MVNLARFDYIVMSISGCCIIACGAQARDADNSTVATDSGTGGSSNVSYAAGGYPYNVAAGATSTGGTSTVESTDTMQTASTIIQCERGSDVYPFDFSGANSNFDSTVACAFWVSLTPGRALDNTYVYYAPASADGFYLKQKDAAGDCGADGYEVFQDMSGDKPVPPKIELCPQACDALVRGSSGTIRLDYGCSDIVPVE